MDILKLVIDVLLLIFLLWDINLRYIQAENELPDFKFTPPPPPKKESNELDLRK